MIKRVLLALVLAVVTAPAWAQGPLRIEITEGVIEPLPVAIPAFVPETPESADMGQQISRVIAADLVGTGLFREIPRDAFISQISDFIAPVQYAD